MDRFAPTHCIRLTRRDGASTLIHVLLVADGSDEGGPAYTREEWEADARADWERQEDGSWTFQGQPMPNGFISVEVAGAVIAEPTREETWQAVMGRSPEALVREFELHDSPGLEGWVGQAKAEACQQESRPAARAALRRACSRHHRWMVEEVERAVAALTVTSPPYSW